MNLNKALLIFGKKTTMAQEIGVTPTVVSMWAGFGKIPEDYKDRAVKALTAYKKRQDKAFQELTK